MLLPGLRSSRRRHPAMVAGLTAVALLAGCSSNAAVTTAPTTTTTGDGSAPTATPAVVRDPPTTATATQPSNAATPLVRQAVLDYWAASRACGQRPKSCHPSSFTAEEGTLRADVQSYVAMLVSSNYHLGPLDTVAPGGTGVSTDTSYVVVNSVTVDLSTNTTATTDECVYDPTPLLGPPEPNGAPTVVSADAVPRRFVHTFYLEGGTWLAGDEQVDTSSACDSAPDTVPVEYTTPGN